MLMEPGGASIIPKNCGKNYQEQAERKLKTPVLIGITLKEQQDLVLVPNNANIIPSLTPAKGLNYVMEAAFETVKKTYKTKTKSHLATD